MRIVVLIVLSRGAMINGTIRLLPANDQPRATKPLLRTGQILGFGLLALSDQPEQTGTQSKHLVACADV